MTFFSNLYLKKIIWTISCFKAKVDSMKFTTFNQVIDFMESFTNLERQTDHYNTRTYRLDRVQTILQLLGNPQNSYKILHVAGTKGKGSTASFLADGLASLGFKTGKFLSPHITDYRERFSLNNRFFDDDLLIETGNELSSKFEGFHFSKEQGNEGPTSFELYTCFAFLLFKNAHCQWAVIETGLGGRLDATNVVEPEAVFLCPIEKEHTKILGTTIHAIATEKSKIIKKNKPVFISKQPKEALDVFLEEAKNCSSPVYYLPDYTNNISQSLLNEDGKIFQNVIIEFKDGYKTHLNLLMLSEVQGNNAALALLGLKTLNLFKEGITEESMNKTTLPGRFEKLEYKRPVYIDGAHTPSSMFSTLDTFCNLFPSNNKIIVYSNVEGKNYQEMIQMVLDKFDQIIITRPGTFKKSDIQILYDYFVQNKKINQKVYLCPEVQEALKQIEKLSIDNNTSVLVTGSFYLAGIFKEAICR